MCMEYREQTEAFIFQGLPQLVMICERNAVRILECAITELCIWDCI